MPVASCVLFVLRLPGFLRPCGYSLGTCLREVQCVRGAKPRPEAEPAYKVEPVNSAEQSQVTRAVNQKQDRQPRARQESNLRHGRWAKELKGHRHLLTIRWEWLRLGVGIIPTGSAFCPTTTHRAPMGSSFKICLPPFPLL